MRDRIRRHQNHERCLEYPRIGFRRRDRLRRANGSRGLLHISNGAWVKNQIYESKSALSEKYNNNYDDLVTKIEEKYEKAFEILLDHLKREFDYCLIDCPAGIDQGFRFATSVADRAILLTTPHISAVKDASRVLQLLHGTKIPNIELIINEYDEKLVRKKYMLSKEDIIELFDIPVLGTIPHDNKIFISQNRGIPVITMRSKATRHFMILSEQMITKLKSEEEEFIYDIS